MEGKPALPLKPSIPYKCFAVCEFLSLLPSPVVSQTHTGRDYVVRIFHAFLSSDIHCILAVVVYNPFTN